MQVSARTDAAAGRTVSVLFDAHARMVLGLCRTLLRDHHDAEDAAQQTFLSAYRALLGGTTPIDPPAWLATIARNECRQRISRRLAAPAAAPLPDDVVAPAQDEPPEQAGRRAEVEVLAAAVAELPERQREAVVLRDFHGLSYEEVAAAMSVSPPAVESLLSRARRRLEDRVGQARATTGVLVVPPSLQEGLARLIPDFAPAATPLAAGGGAAALLTKLASTPALTKAVAAAAVATLAVGADAVDQERPSARAAAPAAPALPIVSPRLDVAEARRLTPARPRHRVRRSDAPASRPTADATIVHPSKPAPPQAAAEAPPQPPAVETATVDEQPEDAVAAVATVDNSGPGSSSSGSGNSSNSGPSASSGSGSSGTSGSSGPSDSSGPSSTSGSSGSGSSGSGSEGSPDG